MAAEEQTRPTPPTLICPACVDGWPLRERLGKLVHIVDDSEYPRAVTCLNNQAGKSQFGATPEPPTPAQPPTGACLMCHWEPDYEKRTHIPQQYEEGTNIWLCVECVTRCKTVDSFGLTVEELHKAADRFKQGAVTSSGAQPPAGIYVASRASIPERSEMWRSLRQGGIKINATWIDEAEENATQSFSELWSRIEREIKSSTGLVLYAEPDDFPLKGALIEVGMALAFGLPVVICAPSVQMSPRNFKPLGSWAKHPLVTFEKSLEIACRVAGRGATQGSSVSATPVTYKGSFDRIRHAILQMAEAPENNLEHEEYAALAVEAQDLSDYLGSISESLAMAASPECTEALANLLGEFLKLHAGRGSQAGTGAGK